VIKPWQCPSKTTQTLGSMQQHLFTLRMHTDRVQERIRHKVSCLAGHRGRPGLCSTDGTPPSNRFIRAQIARSSICSGGRAITQQGLPYSGEREFLWQGEAHAGESPLMLASVAHESRRMLESAPCCALSRCPFYMIFLL
jgi:hypothetical protein